MSYYVTADGVCGYSNGGGSAAAGGGEATGDAVDEQAAGGGNSTTSGAKPQAKSMTATGGARPQAKACPFGGIRRQDNTSLDFISHNSVADSGGSSSNTTFEMVPVPPPVQMYYSGTRSSVGIGTTSSGEDSLWEKPASGIGTTSSGEDRLWEKPASVVSFAGTYDRFNEPQAIPSATGVPSTGAEQASSEVSTVCCAPRRTRLRYTLPRSHTTGMMNLMNCP